MPYRSARCPAGVGMFVAMDDAKTAASSAGLKVLDLSAGSTDLPAPQEALDALAASVPDSDTHKYCIRSGTLPLATEAVTWYQGRYGVSLDATDNALVTIGAQEALGHLLLSAADSGDGILMADVGFPSYFGAIKVAGLTPIYLPLDPHTFLPDFDALSEDKVRDGHAKVLLLNYPNNPTSATADNAFFERAIAFAKRHGLLLVHDSPYVDLTYFEDYAPSPLALPGGLECCVELFSFSKSFNLAGFRLGFALGNADAIAALAAVKGVMDFNQYLGIQRMGIDQHGFDMDANLPDVQRACACRGSGCEKVLQRIARAQAEALSAALAKHAAWDVPIPRSCMYLWARLPERVRDVVDDVEFAMRVLRSTGVAVLPGSAFGPGGVGFVRMALVHPVDVLEAAAVKLAQGIDALLSSGAGE